MAAELREVDPAPALAELDDLGVELEHAAEGDPRAEAVALTELLGSRHGFAGDSQEYDNPRNSMLDLVLQRRRGLPILLSVVYVEVARRAGIPVQGVGLPGHYVVGHFGEDPPLLLDPFNGGAPVALAAPAEVRPWTARETALRMLNNLVGSYTRRADLSRAIRAAEMRLELPLSEADAEACGAELVSLRARLN